MIVVSDTSPISNLIHIGLSHLLVALFGEVVIPPSVADELRVRHNPLPEYLRVHSPRDQRKVRALAEELDPGEAEAIALAIELEADRLLIDEKAGRRIAEQEGVPVIGVLGILLLARRRELIENVRDRLDQLETAGFHLDDALRAEVLRLAGES